MNVVSLHDVATLAIELADFIWQETPLQKDDIPTRSGFYLADNPGSGNGPFLGADDLERLEDLLGRYRRAVSVVRFPRELLDYKLELSSPIGPWEQWLTNSRVSLTDEKKHDPYLIPLADEVGVFRCRANALLAAIGTPPTTEAAKTERSEGNGAKVGARQPRKRKRKTQHRRTYRDRE